MSNGVEIEKKFLVNPHRLPKHLLREPVLIQQGYLSDVPPIVRVRIVTNLTGPDKHYRGYLTVKGQGTVQRTEQEIVVSAENAWKLLKECPKRLSKIRYKMTYQIREWTVDLFPDGLMLAEIEFDSPEALTKYENSDMICPPPFSKQDVSRDPEYTNLKLAEWQGEHYAALFDAMGYHG